MNGIQTVTAVTVAGAFVTGVGLALLGSIKLPLAKRLEIGEARVGGLLSALNLALIPMMLVSGILSDGLGVKGVVLAGSLLTAAAVLSLAVSRSYRGALGAILLAGAGIACLSNGSSVLMPKAFFAGNAAAAVNLGNVFFGVGALATPTVAELLIRWLGFRRALGLLAATCLLPALMAALTVREAFDVPGQQGDLWAVLRNPVVWLAGLAFLLYAPLEGSLGTWATTYLTEVGLGERRAAWLLSGFWLTFLAARLVTALVQNQGILPKGSEPLLIVILALASAVCLGNMAGTQRAGPGVCGLLMVGALFGPIFPTLVGIVFGQVARQDHGTAFGAMFAIGATGSLFLPPLIGAYARRTTVRQALRIPVVMALVLAAVTLFLGLAEW